MITICDHVCAELATIIDRPSAWGRIVPGDLLVMDVQEAMAFLKMGMRNGSVPLGDNMRPAVAEVFYFAARWAQVDWGTKEATARRYARRYAELVEWSAEIAGISAVIRLAELVAGAPG